MNRQPFFGGAVACFAADAILPCERTGGPLQPIDVRVNVAPQAQDVVCRVRGRVGGMSCEILLDAERPRLEKDRIRPGMPVVVDPGRVLMPLEQLAVMACG